MHQGNEGGEGAAAAAADAPLYDEETTERMEKLLNDRILRPLLDDMCDWLARILDLDIDAFNFTTRLQNGTSLCHVADAIKKKADEMGMPCPKIKYKEGAKIGSFQARCNIETFLKWAAELGVRDTCLFETVDIVELKYLRNVLICLLEVSKIADVFGIEPPVLVKLEKTTKLSWQDLIKISMRRVQTGRLMSVADISSAFKREVDEEAALIRTGSLKRPFSKIREPIVEEDNIYEDFEEELQVTDASHKHVKSQGEPSQKDTTDDDNEEMKGDEEEDDKKMKKEDEPLYKELRVVNKPYKVVKKENEPYKEFKFEEEPCKKAKKDDEPYKGLMKEDSPYKKMKKEGEPYKETKKDEEESSEDDIKEETENSGSTEMEIDKDDRREVGLFMDDISDDTDGAKVGEVYSNVGTEIEIYKDDRKAIQLYEHDRKECEALSLARDNTLCLAVANISSDDDDSVAEHVVPEDVVKVQQITVAPPQSSAAVLADEEEQYGYDNLYIQIETSRLPGSNSGTPRRIDILVRSDNSRDAYTDTDDDDVIVDDTVTECYATQQTLTAKDSRASSYNPSILTENIYGTLAGLETEQACHKSPPQIFSAKHTEAEKKRFNQSQYISTETDNLAKRAYTKPPYTTSDNIAKRGFLKSQYGDSPKVTRRVYPPTVNGHGYVNKSYETDAQGDIIFSAIPNAPPDNNRTLTCTSIRGTRDFKGSTVVKDKPASWWIALCYPVIVTDKDAHLTPVQQERLNVMRLKLLILGVIFIIIGDSMAIVDGVMIADSGLTALPFFIILAFAIASLITGFSLVSLWVVQHFKMKGGRLLVTDGEGRGYGTLA